jgi:hypothetical protein
VSNPICNFSANKICLSSKHRDRKKDRKKKKGFKQTKTTKNNMDWSE